MNKYVGILKKYWYLVLILLIYNVVMLFIAMYPWGWTPPLYFRFVSGNSPHFYYFFIEAFLFSVLLGQKEFNLKYPFLIVLIICIFLAVGLEISQQIASPFYHKYLGYKSFSFKDVLLESLGAGVLCLIGPLFLRRKKT